LSRKLEESSEVGGMCASVLCQTSAFSLIVASSCFSSPYGKDIGIMARLMLEGDVK